MTSYGRVAWALLVALAVVAGLWRGGWSIVVMPALLLIAALAYHALTRRWEHDTAATFPNLVRPGNDTPHHGAIEPTSSMPVPSNSPSQTTRPMDGKKRHETELSQLQVESHGAMARFDAEEHPGDDDPRRTDFAALIDTLEQVVFQLDRDGVLRTVSAAWTRLAGQGPDDVIGQTLVGHLHPHDREDAAGLLQRVAAGSQDHVLTELRLLDGDGALHWVELRASTWLDSMDAPAGVAGTLTEITRRKQIEESLRSSRRHLNTLLANVPGMVYRGRHDRNWTKEFVSDGCFELTGHEPQDIVDNAKVAFGDLIHPEDQEFVWALVDTQLAQAKSYQLSYRIVDAAGEIKWVWEQGRGVFSSSDELLALEGFVTDVSARRNAEEQAKRKLWFDARTGLASRAIFDDRLAYVLEHSRVIGYPCAVFWIDLDNFGEVNARFGRDFGDRVLVQMARRFKVVQGPGATVARVGGDEFAVLLTDFREGAGEEAFPSGRELAQACQRFATRVAKAITEPLRMEGRELTMSAGIGIASASVVYPSADAMLQAARRAAVRARAEGAGNVRTAES